MNNKSCEENNRGKKRADEIVELFCCIAKTEENRHVKEYLEKSNIYQEIQNGNEVFLYDSSAANLLEITCELRKDYGDCLGSQYITVDSISDYYREQFGLKKRPPMELVALAEMNFVSPLLLERASFIAEKATPMSATPMAIEDRRTKNNSVAEKEFAKAVVKM